MYIHVHVYEYAVERYAHLSLVLVYFLCLLEQHCIVLGLLETKVRGQPH